MVIRGVSSYLSEPGVLVDVLSFVDRGLQLLQDTSAARQRSRQSRKLPPPCKLEEQRLCAAESIPGHWSTSPSTWSVKSVIKSLGRNVAILSVSHLFATFRGIVLDGLFECRDVTEGAEKQDHLLLFVPNGSDLHKEPDRRP